MSSRLLDTLWKRTGFRLALVSSAVFVAGTLFVFAFSYFVLGASLQARDQDSVSARLRQLAAQYEAADLAALKRSLAFEARLGNTKPYFIRIAGPNNASVFIEIPDRWAEFDLSPLERRPLTELGSFIRLPASDDAAMLEIASMRLPDGSILQVGKSTDERNEILALFGWILAGVSLPVVLLGIVSGSLLAQRALRPVRELIATVRAIDSGAMASRVPVRQTGDELDELAQLFNGMLDRISGLMASMRGSLDNIAHELRTPVTRMRGVAEMALQSAGGRGVAQDALSDCIEESEQILRLLDGLMDLSEANAGTLTLKREAVDLIGLLEGVVDLYQHVAEEKAIVVSLDVPAGIRLIGDRGRLRQVMANLLDNAIKYTPIGGRIDLQTSLEMSDVVISITDTGVGLTPAELSKIWDRLYRGAQARSERGLGLGLSLVKAIVEAHGGRVEAMSSPGGGATFRVILPATPKQPRRALNLPPEASAS